VAEDEEDEEDEEDKEQIEVEHPVGPEAGRSLPPHGGPIVHSARRRRRAAVHKRDTAPRAFCAQGLLQQADGIVGELSAALRDLQARPAPPRAVNAQRDRST
jgi:hypothetical protein